MVRWRTGANCTGGVFWPSTVIANSAGTELFTSGNPGSVQGAQSNASSGVATGSTNVPTIAYSYGWNGASWDQIKATSGGLNVYLAGSQLGAQSWGRYVGAYGSLVNTSVTTNPSGALNGQQAFLNATPAGALRQDATSWAGTLLGLPSNFGTSPGAIEVPGTNSYLWGQAISAEPAAGTNATPVAASYSLSGKAITLPFSNKENAVSGVTAAMTGTTSTQVIPLVASNKIYVTHAACGNSGSTGTFVDLQDGSGGPVLAVLSCGATYAGESDQYWGEISTSSGNGLYVVDETTGASVKVSAQGYYGK